MTTRVKSARPDALRKRSELIAAATKLFVEVGFDVASMDELVKRTGVSKATIYSHFGDKQGLFIAVVDEMMRQHLWPLEHDDLNNLPLEEQLVVVAERTLDVLLAEESIGMARLAFTQAKRFPEIARAVYDQGPLRAIRELAVVLEPHVDEPERKADYFWAMLMQKKSLQGYLSLLKPMSKLERSQHARKVTNDFLQGFVR